MGKFKIITTRKYTAIKYENSEDWILIDIMENSPRIYFSNLPESFSYDIDKTLSLEEKDEVIERYFDVKPQEPKKKIRFKFGKIEIIYDN